jgi:tetratricopeptide (TPR) repeat protein
MPPHRSRSAIVAALATAVVFCAAGGAAWSQSADGVADAQAGQAALDRGDNAEAVARFTTALVNPGFAQADRELAYVRRGEAYLGLGQKELALADATKALGLAPTDAEAATVRDKAQAADGPTLEATLGYIKDKLEGQGRFEWAVFGHNGGSNEDYTRTTHIKYALDPDPAHCSLGFTWDDGSKSTESLGAFKAFSVMTAPEFYTRANAEGGKPEQIVNTTNPVLFVVLGDVGNWADGQSYFVKDEDTANRVALAFTHAMTLCGGGKQAKAKELF